LQKETLRVKYRILPLEILPTYDVYEDDILADFDKVSLLFDHVKINILKEIFPTLTQTRSSFADNESDDDDDDNSFSETESTMSDCDADSEPESSNNDDEKFIGRAIANTTYKKFAKKYGIKIGSKSMNQLAEEIYEYEIKHADEIDLGLYVNPPDISDCDADSEPEPETSKPVKLKFRITRMPNSDSE
jgi:hypothetical protein